MGEQGARIRDWMSSDPITVAADTEVREARRILDDHGFRHLPVVEGDRLVGIVTDRDLRIDQPTLDALTDDQLVERLRTGRSVEAVMSADPYTIGPDEPMSAAARLLLSRRLGALPVVDEDGHLVGVLTTTDCLLALLDGGFGSEDVASA